MDNNSLSHHGVMGMKWGRRRYQNKDGSLTAAGQKRYNKEMDKLEKENKVLSNKLETKAKIDKLQSMKKSVADQKAALKGKKSGESDEEYEANKRKAVESGSATELLKYKGDLTPQEMNYAQARIQWEQNMKNVSDKEVNAGKNRVDDAFNKIGKATEYAEKGIKAYNTIANVYNAFSKNPVSLPKISTNITNDNRALRKKEKQTLKEERDEAAKKNKDAAEKAAYEKYHAEREYKQRMDEIKSGTKSDYKSKSSTIGKDLTDPVMRTGKSKTESAVSNTGTLLLSAPKANEYASRGESAVAGLLSAPKEDD